MRSHTSIHSEPRNVQDRPCTLNAVANCSTWHLVDNSVFECCSEAILLILEFVSSETSSCSDMRIHLGGTPTKDQISHVSQETAFHYT